MASSMAPTLGFFAASRATRRPLPARRSAPWPRQPRFFRTGDRWHRKAGRSAIGRKDYKRLSRLASWRASSLTGKGGGTAPRALASGEKRPGATRLMSSRPARCLRTARLVHVRMVNQCLSPYRARQACSMRSLPVFSTNDAQPREKSLRIASKVALLDWTSRRTGALVSVAPVLGATPSPPCGLISVQAAGLSAPELRILP